MEYVCRYQLHLRSQKPGCTVKICTYYHILFEKTGEDTDLWIPRARSPVLGSAVAPVNHPPSSHPLVTGDASQPS